MNRTNEPASLLLTLTPDKKIVLGCMTLEPDYDFPRFIDIDMCEIGKDIRTKPENWFLRLDYKRRRDFPILSEPGIDAPDLLGQVKQSLAQGKATVAKVLPLFDVYFCRQRGRDPLAPENRHDILVQDILYGTDLYNLCSKDNTSNNLMQGIRTDRGLHLFSADDAGYDALTSCLRYYCDHFFDKQRGTDRLDVVSVYPLGETPHTLGKDMDCRELFNYKPLDLPETFFCRDPALIELTERKFDMLPPLNNMCTLLDQNGIIEMDCSEPAYNFMCLAMLHSGQCINTDDLPLHPFTEFAFEDTFRDLMREMQADVSGSNTASIAARVRERAEQLLETHFPDLRYCREPEQIEAQLREQNPDQAVCPERQRRGPKL